MQKLSKMVIFNRSMRMVILIGLLVCGCASPPERLHPQFPSYRKSMATMLVLVPEIGIFEQMPDGSRLFQDTQSREAQRIAQQSIAGQLLKRHFTVQTADAEMMQRPAIRGITSLYRSVNRSIQLHTFGPQIFPSKLSAFDYSLGPIADILEANKADGLVLAVGHQTSSGQPDKNWLSMAVVEAGGRIIWYGVQGDHQKFNLQSPEDMSALVAYTMINFWETGL